jgi:hypothetical protein
MRIAALLLSVELTEGELRWPTRSDWCADDEIDERTEETLANFAARDDDALLELVRRDKRYAFSQLAMVRVLEWTALVQRRMYDLPEDIAKRKQRQRAGTDAETKLRAFANALQRTGDSSRFPTETFAREYKSVRARVVAATSDSRDSRAVAREHGLHERTIATLRRGGTRPAQLDAIVTELALRYGISEASVRRHYDEACDLDLLDRHVGRRSKQRL